jgi:hypothetical protein
MAKKSEKEQDQKKTLALIFVEGDTEVDFYNKLKEHLRQKLGGKLACEVKIHNLKGVGQYQNTAQRIFEKRVKVDYPPEEYRYHIFLCYDTDVFEYAKKPPVDWPKVIKMLKGLGADEVLRVEAKTSIEDWFLLDIEGLRAFLKIPKKTKLSGYKGQNGLKQVFLKANRTYIKGIRCAGLVDALDMNVIFPKICGQIYVICKTAGMDCSREKACR